MPELSKGFKVALYKTLYHLGILISSIPYDLRIGVRQLSPKKAVWRMKYKQGYNPLCVWFDTYPNYTNVEHIGKDSYSADAISGGADKIYIGDDVHIGPGLVILYKTMRPKVSKTSLHIGNKVSIGKDTKIMIGGEFVICDGAMVGAGSIVTKSITKKGTYAGIPARLVSNVYNH